MRSVGERDYVDRRSGGKTLRSRPRDTPLTRSSTSWRNRSLTSSFHSQPSRIRRGM